MPGSILFSAIQAEHIVAHVEQALERYQEGIDKLTAHRFTRHSFHSLMHKLEELSYDFNRIWSAIQHLNSVKKTENYKEEFEKAKVLVTNFNTEMFQNKDLFQLIFKLKESKKFDERPNEEKALINDYLRGFRMTGIDLPSTEQKTLKAIRKQLSTLKEEFANNKTLAIDAWTLNITDEATLKGLPQGTIDEARKRAEKDKVEGWVLTLAPNMVTDVLKYADSRDLRQEYHRAYYTLASDYGDDPKQDNSLIMTQILKLRQQEAKLLGFADHVDLSLHTKMANREQVDEMLIGLAKDLRPLAQKELDRLKSFAKQEYGITDLKVYDLGYISNKYKEKMYAVDDKKLKEYFPVDKVLSGMFEVVQKLFGITLKEQKGFDTWDPEVRLFSVHDQEGKLLGEIYFDMFARNGEKRAGAWMNDCEGRFEHKGESFTPIAFLNTNFGKGLDGKPALLSHREVQTTFHEFGHCLHHVLSQCKYPSIAGPNGVPWDTVEAPSQMMENWIWDPETLKLFSSHYETGEPLPDDLMEAISKLRYYNEGIGALQQICYSLFDFRLHGIKSEVTPADIHKVWLAVRNNIQVLPTEDYDHMPNTFHHLFSGGYSAGYYGYKWSLNLAHDMFSEFKKHGIMNPEVGKRYVETILAPGGSEEFVDLVTKFLGRPPNLKAVSQAIRSGSPLANEPDDAPALLTPSSAPANNKLKSWLGSGYNYLKQALIPSILGVGSFVLRMFVMGASLASSAILGAGLFAASYAASWYRESFKTSSLKHLQDSPANEMTETEKQAFLQGVDSQQSLGSQLKSCFQWEAYKSKNLTAYYGGMKAEELGEAQSLKRKLNL